MPILDAPFWWIFFEAERRPWPSWRSWRGGEGRVPLSPLPITALEQRLRAFLSEDPERSLAAARKLLDSLVVLPLDDEAAIVFGALAARLRSEGKRIGDFDEVIAAIALDSIREIVTRDGNFREVAGIKVVDWKNSRAF